MITRSQAKAAEGKAILEARRAFHLIPTSVSIVRTTDGRGLRIGLPRKPGNLETLLSIDGVPVEVDVVGPASLLG